MVSKPSSVLSYLIAFACLGTCRLAGSAGMPDVNFHYLGGDSFQFAAPAGDGTFFTASSGGTIAHVNASGSVLSDLASPFVPDASGIFGFARDSSTGQLFVSGLLIYGSHTSSVVRLNPDGTIATDFGHVSLLNTLSDDSAGAAYLPCVAPDGLGGCYVGGPFNFIDGNPATGLVHLAANGTKTSLPRLNSASESPIFLAALSDGVIVVQSSVVYKVSSDGTQTRVLVPATDWEYVISASYDAAHGLTLVGQTPHGAFIYVYDVNGNKLSSFRQSVGFNSTPYVTCWDAKGNMIVGNARLISSNDALGIKRLLPNGDLDPAWTKTLTFNGGVGAMAVLAHSIIASGGFDHVDGMATGHVVKLDNENAAGQMANQSALAYVDGEGNALTMGLAIGGHDYVDVLLRASGPSLAEYGVSETPSSTSIDLYQGQMLYQVIQPGKALGPVYSEADAIKAITPLVGAFPLVTLGYDEAEALLAIPPGVYSLVITCPSGQKGKVLGEIYFP